MPYSKSQSQRQQRLGSRGGFSVSNISITYRLPLLIGTLLFIVIVACSWASYRSVKTSAMEVGRERLQNLTQQLSGLLQQSANNITTKTASVAGDPVVREFVKSPATGLRADVQKLLQQFEAPADANSLGVELWSRESGIVFSAPEAGMISLGDLATEFQQCGSEPFRTVGAIRRVKDTVGFPAVAAVRNEQGAVIGYLVRWRRFAATPNNRQQMTKLLGTSATLYLGNNGNDIWTDLENVVPRPAIDLRSLTDVSTYDHAGSGTVIGMARPISGTPWSILIEFPDDVVQKPVNSFLKRIAVIGLFVFVMGVAGAFVLSRNITKPLNELTKTATAISKGDESRTVNVRQKDELGQLASAFNAMVAQVRDSQHELERKVQERTLQLEEANRQLESLSQTNVLKRTEAEKEKTDALEALRNTEKQLVQSQKLEAVGRLAGGISHDFNNLLTVILGYSDITLRQLRDHPLRRNLEEIVRASERAASLTRQLLAFSRKQVMQPKVFDVNTVVTDLEKMLRRMIGEDVELRVSLQSDLGNIKADPVQLEQVIMNLVVNARDAMPKGGKLSIETTNVYLDESYALDHVSVEPGHYVMLAISDTGVGMDAETRQHIFEPFFTTKAAGKGTGLGLSMVYGIVRQSGGNIWVYSEEGRGTTFKIYFPRVTETAEEYKRATATIQVPTGSETILLVEDADWVRKLARQVLEGAGYRVLEASSADAAIRLSEASDNGMRIDLLLTDVVMPGMSGNDMSKRVLVKRPNLPVLYMSGYTDDAIVQHGVLEPGINFIQKPFSPDALALKVREVLDARPQPAHHR